MATDDHAAEWHIRTLDTQPVTTVVRMGDGRFGYVTRNEPDEPEVAISFGRGSAPVRFPRGKTRVAMKFGRLWLAEAYISSTIIRQIVDDLMDDSRARILAQYEQDSPDTTAESTPRNGSWPA